MLLTCFNQSILKPNTNDIGQLYVSIICSLVLFFQIQFVSAEHSVPQSGKSLVAGEEQMLMKKLQNQDTARVIIALTVMRPSKAEMKNPIAMQDFVQRVSAAQDRVLSRLSEASNQNSPDRLERIAQAVKFKYTASLAMDINAEEWQLLHFDPEVETISEDSVFEPNRAAGVPSH